MKGAGRDGELTWRVGVAGAERPPPTRAMCEAASRLGIRADASDPRDGGVVEVNMSAGSRVLVQGASGSGKSTLLRRIGEEARARGWRVVVPAARMDAGRAVLSVFRGPRPVEWAMSRLARAGLGDATVFLRRVGELSTGELARLRLALAVEEAERAAQDGLDVLLVVDELGSGLDPVTGWASARLLSVALESSARVRLVAATSRTDLEGALRATARVRLEHGWAGCAARLDEREREGPRVRIEAGTREDYRRLSGLHYRLGPPATITRVFRAVGVGRVGEGELAGVLTLSLPTLNAAWRERAWPGRYSSGDKRRDARRLNREVRCISRVIVSPGWRGLGVARRLVRHALECCETPGVEALAAMGASCPFFRRAGMTEYVAGRGERDWRLLDLLEQGGVERWRLATPGSALRRAVDSLGAALVEREVRRWAGLSRSTRGHAGEEIGSLFARACAVVGCEMRAYAWTKGSGG